MLGAPKILAGRPLVVPGALKYPKNKSCPNGPKITPKLLLKIMRNLAEALFLLRFPFGTELNFCTVALSRSGYRQYRYRQSKCSQTLIEITGN